MRQSELQTSVVILNAGRQKGALQALQPAWDDLAAEASEGNIFFESWMLLPALDKFSSEETPLLLLVYAHATGSQPALLIGLFPIIWQNEYARLPVGHWKTWLHPYAFLGTPLVRRSFEADFAKAVHDYLADRACRAHFLHLAMVSKDGAVLSALQQHADLSGRQHFEVKQTSRALLHSNENAEAYLARSLRGKKRKELRRQSRRLGDSGPVAFRYLDDAGELDLWIDHYLSLEAAGWKGRAGSALTANPNDADYFRAVLRGAFARNRLLFLRMEVGGQAIAMLVTFLGGTGAYSFKIAYDEDYAKFSPGVLIEMELMRYTLDRSNLEWVDSCARENHPMIDHLWRERRSLIYLNVGRDRFVSIIILRLCRLLEMASHRVRSRVRLG